MIGQTLNNRYKVMARLGKGAMGTVYRATDTQNGQEVALKVISSELAIQPEMLERFKREGESLRKLKHPNIVGFLDAFQHGEQYVIAMEYVSGGSLHELIKSGRLPIERARQIALDLCDALIRAHRLNIIHRDIKPENILIDEDGTPKLADFGVAKLSEGTRMTRSGTQVGTPYYMAPEAWTGEALDGQADIWSLGVLLFEMLTGEVPFGGDTPMVVMSKINTTLPPDLKKLRADVPPRLVKIVSRMLTRDKKRRYQTMREVGVDLERSGGETTHRPPKGNRIATPKFRFIFIFGILLVVGGFLVAKWLPSPVTPAPTESPRATKAPTQASVVIEPPTATEVPISTEASAKLWTYTDMTVGFLQTGSEAGWRAANTASFRESAEQLGITLKFYDSQNDLAKQVAGFRQFIEDPEVNVIVMAPLEVTGWEQVLKDAKAAGKPVILSDRTIDGFEDLYATFVGADFVEEGRKAGTEMCKLLEGSTSKNVWELVGSVGSSPAIDRGKGFRETAGECGILITNSQTGNWSVVEGKQVTESWLKESEDVQGIFGQNDEMALGAIEALKEAGLVPAVNVKIISVDATAGAFQAMLDGTLNVTIECNPLIAPQVYEAALAALNGETLPRWIPSTEGVFYMIDPNLAEIAAGRPY